MHINTHTVYSLLHTALLAPAVFAATLNKTRWSIFKRLRCRVAAQSIAFPTQVKPSGSAVLDCQHKPLQRTGSVHISLSPSAFLPLLLSSFSENHQPPAINHYPWNLFKFHCFQKLLCVSGAQSLNINTLMQHCSVCLHVCVIASARVYASVRPCACALVGVCAYVCMCVYACACVCVWLNVCIHFSDVLHLGTVISSLTPDTVWLLSCGSLGNLQSLHHYSVTHLEPSQSNEVSGLLKDTVAEITYCTYGLKLILYTGNNNY